MPHYNVEFDDKWTTFTSIADGFLKPLTSVDEHEKWRNEKYNGDLLPLENSNRMTLQDCALSIVCRESGNPKTKQKCIGEFVQIGIPDKLAKAYIENAFASFALDRAIEEYESDTSTPTTISIVVDKIEFC